MLKGHVALLLLFVMALAGCGLIRASKAVVDDAKTGVSTPRQEGEEGNLPQDWAKLTTDLLSMVFPPAAVPAGLAVLWLTGFVRGRKLKQQMPMSNRPATGFLGAKTGIEAVVQHLSTVFKGLFEVGEEGSVAKRSWKIALASGLGLSVIPWLFSIGPIRAFVEQHQAAILAFLAGVPAVIAAAEKQLSEIRPLAPKPVEPTPVTPTT